MATFRDYMEMATRKAEKEGSSGKRFREVLGILKKHDAIHGLTPKKAVDILVDLGPTFIKLGQIASTHPDILPQDYCDAFAQLRANVSPMDAQAVKERIQTELGKPVDELFATFDDTALGSASIAQVHKATLKENGAIVAVKVQRPGVAETVTNDLALLRKLIAIYEFLEPEDGQISLKQLVDELMRTSKDELDFTIEAKNLTKFYENNEKREKISSPRCYTQYSNPAVLTMDYASGTRVGAIDSIKSLTPKDREDIAYLIADNYMAQMMIDGFFHADPHAGNILVQEADKSIEWIDFGMMGSISSKDRETFQKIITAIVRQNAYDLKRAMLRIAVPTGPIDHGELLAECEHVIDQYATVDLENFNTANLLNDLMSAMSGSGFEFDSSITMLGRGLVTLEGTISMVSSSLNIMQVLKKYMLDAFSPKVIADRAMKATEQAIDSAEALTALPTKAVETLDMIQKGQVKAVGSIEVDQKFRADLKSSINHFALMVMAAALFMGSCVLCLSNLQPIVLGVPLLGMIGFVTGLFIAIFDFVYMYKEGRKRR